VDIFKELLLLAEKYGEISLRQVRPGQNRWQLFGGATQIFDGTRNDLYSFIMVNLRSLE
jgi:hypothetical protein